MMFSILSTVIYMAVLDIFSCYVKSPSSFPVRTWRSIIFKPKPNLPLVKPHPGAKDFKEVLKRGSQQVRRRNSLSQRVFHLFMKCLWNLVDLQYPDKPYRIPHHPYEWIIIPYKMIDEIRNMPESKLSFQQGSYDFFMGWHTGITNHERVVANILKTGVNRLIDTVYAIVQDESYRTVLENIGDCPGECDMLFNI